MVLRLGIKVGDVEVDRIETKYVDTQVALLEKIFPKAHWTGENPEAIDNPPEFDFLGKADTAGLAIQDYLRQVEDNPEGECWAELFMRTYHVGKALQKLGLQPRVLLG
jgi:hypothetical protein